MHLPRPVMLKSRVSIIHSARSPASGSGSVLDRGGVLLGVREVLAGSVLLASLSWYLVERPARGLLRGPRHRRARSPAGATA
jgi:peptidoglycan/LPS O-acetylase OafA/YrhL